MNSPGNPEPGKESDPILAAYKPGWRERIEDLRPYFGPVIAGMVIAGVAGWWSWQRWGPHRPRTDREPRQVVDRPASSRGVELEPWEETLQKAADGGSEGARLESMVTEMIEQQRARLKGKQNGNDDEVARLTRMEKVRAALRARTAAARSAVLEQEAGQAEKNGQHEVALEKRREALKLQREANANAGPTDLRNLVRESQLDARVVEAEAKPLHDLVMAALDRAKAAVAAENWADALEAYQEARTLQMQINGRFSSTRFANIDAVEAIDSEIASINAASLAGRVAASERDGEKAMVAGSPEAAAGAYAAAASAQKEINERFSSSRFASAARADEF